MRKSISKLAFTSFTMMTMLFLLFSSCKKDEPTIGDPPTAADAAFTYTESSTSANIIQFTATNSSLSAQWDLGNGATASGTTVSGVYPYAGTYTVVLTVQNSGGSANSTQDIVIAQDDPTLINNPLFDLLTGGVSGPGYKSWAIDSVVGGHFGVGPNPSGAAGDYPEWYAASALEKSGSGMYNDLYTFHLQNFVFDMITNGDVYVNSAIAGTPPFTDTSASNVGDFTAQYPDLLGETWVLNEGEDTSITLSGDAMMAYWTGAQTYKIVHIEENQLILRWEDASNEGLAWYATFVPEGYVSNPDPPAPSYSLPLDFEVIEPEFTTFGNSTDTIIDNPDASGINTSSKVLETVHGNETWAGLYVNLENNLDFSTQTSIKIKVWAPVTGPFRLKLESQADANSFIEIDVDVTVASSWQELTFDMTGTPTSFDRLVMFPGWNVANAGTFYLDDIKQE
jgi:PKD repeat protein